MKNSLIPAVLANQFLGFDRQFERMNRFLTDGVSSVRFPPVNIVKDGESRLRIDLAVAGYAREDLDIEQVKNTLIIKAQKEEKTDESGENYIVKGIATRSFVRQFDISEYWKVVGATLKNGILSVSLEEELPEHKQPRKIGITEDTPVLPATD